MKHFNSFLKMSLLGLVNLLVACSSVPKVPQNIYLSNQNDCVVLLHGLWRSAFAMNSIEDYLQGLGYQTVNVDYPSTEFDIATLSRNYLAPAVETCRTLSSGDIHLVSHSMGGILVRDYLQTARLDGDGKVVMLSPPNQGSELSARFGDRGWYECFLGPAGSSLSYKESGSLSELKEISEPVGVIAAYRSWSLWPNTLLPSPNDGVVSVKSMILPEMDDFVAVNSGHAMMRHNDVVHRQIAQFLSNGKFSTELMTSEDVAIVQGFKGHY